MKLLVLLAALSGVHCFPRYTSPSRCSTALDMKASINMALSVDGFIATKDGGVDWLNEQPSIEGEDHGFQEFMDSVDVMIMGRKTFEKVLSFGKDAWAYGDKRIVVWSRGSVEIPGHLEKTASTSSDKAPDLLAKLEAEGCSHAYIDGGYTIRQFLKAGLIQRMVLTRVPILLGDGIPLFEDQGRLNLSHVSTRSWPNGLVQTVYDVVY